MLGLLFADSFAVYLFLLLCFLWGLCHALSLAAKFCLKKRIRSTAVTATASLSVVLRGEGTTAAACLCPSRNCLPDDAFCCQDVRQVCTSPAPSLCNLWAYQCHSANHSAHEVTCPLHLNAKTVSDVILDGKLLHGL